MIGTIDISVNAAHPNMSLEPFRSFVGSPSNVRVKGVPKKIGSWEIQTVFLIVSYPDNTIHTDECTEVNGVWVGSIPSCETSGKFASGFQITASGTDEDGQPIYGYVLGIGDVVIYDRDQTIHIDGTTYYIHLVEDTVEAPNKGDVKNADGNWQLYNGTEWIAFGGREYEAGEGLKLEGNVFSLKERINTTPNYIYSEDNSKATNAQGEIHACEDDIGGYYQVSGRGSGKDGKYVFWKSDWGQYNYSKDASQNNVLGYNPTTGVIHSVSLGIDHLPTGVTGKNPLEYDELPNVTQGTMTLVFHKRSVAPTEQVEDRFTLFSEFQSIVGDANARLEELV